MTLREYLTKYKISVETLATRCEVSGAAIWHYMAGRRRPTRKIAQRIEKESDGIVTVTQLRGEDGRRRHTI